MDDHEPNTNIRTRERLFSMRKGRTLRVKKNEVTEAVPRGKMKGDRNGLQSKVSACAVQGMASCFL